MMKAKPVAIALSAALLALPLVAQAQQATYKNIVSYEAIKPHVEVPKADDTAFVVDSRPAAQHDVGHIGCTANISDSQLESLQSKLPQEKSKEVIFYCDGPSCDLPHKSAHTAEKLGYTNVKVFDGGMGEWAAKGENNSVSVAFILKMLETKADIMLIDARPVRRVQNEGTIPGAINIPDSSFEKEIGKLPADKNKEIIYFCQGCKCDLSEKSAKKARALGYKNVRTFAGGHPAYLAATRGQPAPMAQAAQGMAGAMAQAAGAMAGAAATVAAIIIEPGKDKGSISTSSFERIIKENPTQIAIIDVRDEKDVKKGTFPGAINIPVGDIEKKLAELPKGKPIVFTCSTGARSGEAYDTVKMLGGKDIEAYFLDADVSCTGSVCKIMGR